MERRYDFGDSVALEQRQDVLHDRLIAYGSERFWPVRRERAQSRTLAASHHHSLHSFRRSNKRPPRRNTEYVDSVYALSALLPRDNYLDTAALGWVAR